MPVVSNDLKWFKSSSGSSEGGAMSAVEIVSGADNNVFADVSDVAALAGGEQIRKIVLLNDNGVDTLAAHSIWIVEPTAEGTGYIAFGFDDADDGQSNLNALTTFSAGAKVALVSDGADTRSVDVWGVVGGVPTKETVVLTGASQVLTAATFDSGKVWACHTTISASRVITIKQGTGGTTRGSIGIGDVLCTQWLAATAQATGLLLPALPTGATDGIWEKVVYGAATPAHAGVDLHLRVKPL